MLVRRFSPLQSTGQPPGVAYLKIANGQTGVYVIHFPAHCVGVTNMSHHYNLSPAVQIYRQHRRMRSSSASQKDYRLVYDVQVE